jgi:hypothetical protein
VKRVVLEALEPLLLSLIARTQAAQNNATGAMGQLREAAEQLRAMQGGKPSPGADSDGRAGGGGRQGQGAWGLVNNLYQEHKEYMQENKVRRLM